MPVNNEYSAVRLELLKPTAFKARTTKRELSSTKVLDLFSHVTCRRVARGSVVGGNHIQFSGILSVTLG